MHMRAKILLDFQEVSQILLPESDLRRVLFDLSHFDHRFCGRCATMVALDLQL